MGWSLKQAKNAVVEEALDTWRDIRYQRCTLGFVFAVACVLIVIVGNVILLIGINFWLTVFPTDNLEHNSSQIAIQVVASMLMVLFFTAVAVVFTVVFGGVPMWRALTDTNRMGHPLYRLFLLFASGASNGLSGVTGVYSMSHTPEFIQAVLLCCIPFSAQAWTVVFIPEERKRNYLSLFFIASFVLFVAGVLLSSMSAFLQQSEHAEKASWDWALMYLLSSILFGLWCVVQRLYLDAMIVREGCERERNDAGREGVSGASASKKPGTGQLVPPTSTSKVASREPELSELGARREDRTASTSVAPREPQSAQEREPVTVAEAGADRASTVADCHVDVELCAVSDIPQSASAVCIDGKGASSLAGAGAYEADGILQKSHKDANPSLRRQRHYDELEDDLFYSADDEDGGRGEVEDDLASAHALLLAEKRSWARQSVNDNAAKLVLLLGGLLFQLLVSFVVFPVDAIPWFGTSATVREAWEGFANSVNFIFRSWYNIRYGLLYTLGYIMSFIGCTFLNEHSPTLASVVLQLAGPITSLVIIIIPQWNVYKDSGNVGHKVGGVLLLLVAAFLYHVWEQRSLKEMIKRAHAEYDREGDDEAPAPDPAQQQRSVPSGKA